ncbi:MAG TPA: 4Fe-4S dicluster domain-containing protein [Phycisphaerae bacterium]|jgi:formate hydrogenlyase subunit 6/NADH:ubiquinone oxidoreductase subunit I|nr:4Fe-4S dicluster domain-containing protein [Phycisphaerae bacterium]
MAFDMTRLVLKWAFRKPVTSHYPFAPRQPLAGSRGKLIFNNSDCIYCTICDKKCPTGALAVDRVKKTWALDRLRCISCGACVDNCPKKSLELIEMHGGPSQTRDREFPPQGPAASAQPCATQPPAAKLIPINLVKPDPKPEPVR